MTKSLHRLAALVLALLLLVLSGCGGSVKETVTPAATPATPPASAAPTAEPSPAPTADPDYLDRITFLGDSTTYGLKAYAMLSGGKETQQVWTPASGTLTLSNQSWATIVYPPTGQEIPIREAVEDARPEILVITLGVNGVSFLTEEGFKSEYKALVTDVQSLSPETKIICNSIYPVESDIPVPGEYQQPEDHCRQRLDPGGGRGVRRRLSGHLLQAPGARRLFERGLRQRRRHPPGARRL
jgi:hypothetical protein